MLKSRKQYVRFKSSFTSSKTINTGGSQGCVLATGLFTLYTSTNESSHDKCTIAKYANEMMIRGLLDNSNDTNGENCYV